MTRRLALLHGTALAVLATPAVAQIAPSARPTGGAVVGGQAGITQSGNTTTINQQSQSAALTWQSFNVGSAQTVNFKQPDSSAIALNTVVGPDPSEIAGHITANGQIVIVNQAGVVFDHGAQVDTAGLVVSAAGITTQNFMAGRMVFNQAAHAGAKIVNNGTLTIRQAGLAALVAPQVANAGLIQARLGRVILGGAAAYTLDLYGDGLLALNVTNQVTAVTIGNRSVAALVTNEGVILADGGTVMLTAQAADGLIRTLVDAGGTIRANTVGATQGRILVQGIGGSVQIDGGVAATGLTAGTTGGQVVANATGTVTLAATANIDASGDAGGGLIAIGTTAARAAGGPHTASTLTARSVHVASGAHISANAQHRGNGGHVTLLSSGDTSMSGAISVLGGALAGNGGTVEISGATVGLAGLVNATAPAGHRGGLLIDPGNVYVADGPVSNLGTNTQFTPAALEAQNANVTLSATGNVDFLYTAGGTNSLALGANNLSVTAGTGIDIDRGFSISAGTVSMTASSGALTFGTSDGVALGLGAAGTAAPALSAASIALSAASITLGPVTATGALSLAATGGDIVQSAGTSLTAGTLSGSASGAALLGSASNDIGTVVSFTTGGSLVIASVAPTLTVGGNLTAGTQNAPASVDLDSVGFTVSAGSTISAPSGTIAITLGGNIDLAGQLTTGSTTAGVIGFTTSGFGGVLPFDGTAGHFTTGELALGSLNGFTESGGLATLALESNLDLTGHASTLGLFTGPSGVLLASSGITVSTLVGSAGTATVTGSNAIGTLGNFLASSLTFSEPGNLAVTGSVGDGTLVSITAQGGNTGLDITGSISATNVTLDSPYIPISGSINAPGTLTLISPGSGVFGTGVVDTGLLNGTVAFASLTGNNSIAAIGSLTATGGVAINDIEPLTVGTLSAGLATLDATSLTIDGPLTISNGLTLVATSGSITGSGAVSAGTLSLTAPGSAVLTGNATVSVLGTSAVGGSLSLTDTGDLTIQGTVTAGSAASPTALTNISSASPATITLSQGNFGVAAGGLLSAPGGTIALTLAGTLSVLGTISTGSTGVIGLNNVGTLYLAGPGGGFVTGELALGSFDGVHPSGLVTAIDLDGAIDLQGVAGTLGLFTTAGGTITSTSGITAATLIGSTGTATFSGSNAITSIGDFAVQNLTLSQTGALAIDGHVGGGTLAAITAGALTIGGTLPASSTTLTAASISIPGSVIASTGLSMFTTQDGAAASGTISTPSLTGGIEGNATFTGSNSIGTLSDFTAAGNLTLTNGQALSIGAGVAGQQITITAPSISLPGTLTATSGVALTANDGSITGPGTISAPTLTLDATGAVSLPGGSTVTTLGNSTIGGNVTFSDTGTLTIAGTVIAGSTATPATVDFSVGGVVVNSGALLSAPSGTIGVLLGGGISVYGTISTGSTGVIGLANNGTGSYFIDTSVFVTGELALGSLDGVTAYAGQTALNLNGGIDLTSSVGTLGLFTSASGSVAATGGITAQVLAGNVGTFALSNTGSIGAFGNFTAASLSYSQAGNVVVNGDLGGSATSLTSTGGSVAINGQIASGIATLNAATAIVIPGSVAGTTSVALASQGTISETGTLSTPSLSVSAAGLVTLAGSNSIATLTAAAANGFTLYDSPDLTVAGTLAGGAAVTIADAGTLTLGGSISATSATFDAAAITIGGAITAPGTLALNGTIAGVSETGGTLTAGLLTGTSAGGTLDGTNAIGTLGDISITGGGILSLADQIPLTVSGNVTSALLNLSAPSILVSGAITTSSTALTATSGAISGSGSIVTDSLTGSATGSFALTGSNHIATLGGITADGISLSATGALLVSGQVNGQSAVAITTTGTLSSAGSSSITGSAVTLAGGALALGGTIDATQSTSLAAASGNINQTGTLTTGVLSATATGTVDLAFDSIAQLASSSAGGSFSVQDFSALEVTGTVTAGSTAAPAPLTVVANGLTIDSGSALSAPGGSILLRSNTIDLAGVASTGTAGLIGLASDGGSTLAIATSGTFTTGELSVGSLNGSALTGNIQEIDLAGTLALAGTTGTLGLFTSPGGSLVSAVALSAAITAGTLIGSVGSLSLTGSSSILDIGAFSASSFTYSQANDLAITGPVTGTALVDISTAGSLTVGGQVSAPSTALAAGTGITITGGVTGTGTLGLSASGAASTIREQGAGSLTAGLLSVSAGTVALGGSGNLITSLASISAPGGLTLVDATAGLTVSQPITSQAIDLSDAGILTVTGALSAPAISLQGGSVIASGGLDTGTAGSLIVTGPMAASSIGSGPAGNVSITGTNSIGTLSVQSDGSVSIGGSSAVATLSPSSAASFTLADTQSLSIASGLAVTGQATLQSAGAITEGPHGLITAGTFSATTTGSLALAASNSITTLGSISAAGLVLDNAGSLQIVGTVTGGATAGIVSGGTLTLAASGSIAGTTTTLSAAALNLAGSIAAPGSVAMTASAGGITDTGAVTAGMLSGSATGLASFSGSNTVAALGNFTASGFTLADTTSLAVTGTLSAASSATLTVASGSITASGVLMTPSLSLAAPGGASLTGANQVGTLTLADVAGGLTLTDETALTLATNIAAGAGAVNISAPSLTVDGSVSAGGDITLAATSGSFTQGPGTIGTSSGSGTINLTAATLFSLAGTLAANTITIGAAGGASNLTVDWVGNVLESSLPSPSTQAAALATTGGGDSVSVTAANFHQSGQTLVESNAAIDITLTGSGTARFGSATGAGLVAPGATLALNLGSGSAAGNIDVAALSILYTSPAPGSITSLNGTIGGASGQAAAQDATIQPASNANYLFNGCEIAAACAAGPSNTQTAAAQVPIFTPATVPQVSIVSSLQDNGYLGGGDSFQSGDPSGANGSADSANSDPVGNSPRHLQQESIDLIIPHAESRDTARRRRLDDDLIVPNIGEEDF